MPDNNINLNLIVTAEQELVSSSFQMLLISKWDQTCGRDLITRRISVKSNMFVWITYKLLWFTVWYRTEESNLCSVCA